MEVPEAKPGLRSMVRRAKIVHIRECRKTQKGWGYKLNGRMLHMTLTQWKSEEDASKRNFEKDQQTN